MTGADVEALLLDALAALPTEPDEIARVFAELDIKGRRGAARSCPVARYVAAETGLAGVAVGSVHTYATPEDWCADTPEHVGQFVRGFDLGDYPQLDADAPDAS